MIKEADGDHSYAVAFSDIRCHVTLRNSPRVITSHVFLCPSRERSITHLRSPKEEDVNRWISSPNALCGKWEPFLSSAVPLFSLSLCFSVFLKPFLLAAFEVACTLLPFSLSINGSNYSSPYTKGKKKAIRIPHTPHCMFVCTNLNHFFLFLCNLYFYFNEFFDKFLPQRRYLYTAIRQSFCVGLSEINFC